MSEKEKQAEQLVDKLAREALRYQFLRTIKITNDGADDGLMFFQFDMGGNWEKLDHVERMRLCDEAVDKAIAEWNTRTPAAVEGERG